MKYFEFVEYGGPTYSMKYSKYAKGFLSETFQNSQLVTAEEMKHLHIEVKPALKSGRTKWKLSKSGIVDFGGNCGPKQHHQQPKWHYVLVYTISVTTQANFKFF